MMKDKLTAVTVSFLLCLAAVLSAHFILLFFFKPTLNGITTAAIIFFACYIAFTVIALIIHIYSRKCPLIIKSIFYTLRFLISLGLTAALIFVFGNLQGPLFAAFKIFSFIAALTLNLIIFLMEFLDMFFAKTFKERIEQDI